MAITRPPDVHIDDLAEPRLPVEIEEMMKAVEPIAAEVVLAERPLMAMAEERCGLSDYGADDHFRVSLRRLLEAFEVEAGLSSLGRIGIQEQIIQLLVNRLLIEQVLRTHPEIHDIEISRPMIIAGLPRTGTTHLHNLMSADPALRSLPYWESLEPVLAASETPAPGEPDPRIARTDERLANLNRVVPYFKRMHDMTTWHVHEEIQLLAIDFSTMLFETMAVMPGWRDYYMSVDQTPSYEYLRTVLKVLQWSRGGDRWVLKSPQHLEQLGPLSTVFPDATVILTHRDPVSVTASLATMVAYTARVNLRVVEPERIGRYWADRIETMLSACVGDRDLLSASSSIDVRFNDFMAGDVATVERIYRLAGQPLTSTARSAMDSFMSANPRGKHGRVRYVLRDVGLDRAERRRALRFYTERFGVEEEDVPED